MWKIDLRNLLGFLSLRMDAHAQQEIRAYANVIGLEFVAKAFPWTWAAFNDYDPRRDAMILTALERRILVELTKRSRELPFTTEMFYVASRMICPDWADPAKKIRERGEAFAKFQQLGLVA